MVVINSSKKIEAQVRGLVKLHTMLPCLLLVLTACTKNNFKIERQLTTDFSQNHDLDNNDNFSPDDQWLVYDTRTEEGGIGANGKIEKVNVITGEKVVLYELDDNAKFGPGVGAASYDPTENQVIFIHGLLNASAEYPYQQWRRTGVIVADTAPGVPIFMDARDTSYPYTSGALRGGTHRHEWSGDGQCIGFTYNDAILKKREDSTGVNYNLRTIGVSKKGRKVIVNDTLEDENFSGEWFSALVVKVKPDPKKGGDEISRAEGDSWVGTTGYKKENGTRQRARAFIGTVRDKTGKEVKEVFIVDIPECISCVGEEGPLEGTKTSFPSPPAGTVQRRLTYTAASKFPGCEGVVRSAHDGSLLAFLAYDDTKVKQVFTIPPTGGAPAQQTFHKTDVQSGVRWQPNAYSICYVWNNTIVRRKIGEKAFDILTEPSTKPPMNLVWSHDGTKIAYNRTVTNFTGQSAKQLFVIDL